MNRNDTEFMVQKIRTQYMEKDNAQKELFRLIRLLRDIFFTDFLYFLRIPCGVGAGKGFFILHKSHSPLFV